MAAFGRLISRLFSREPSGKPGEWYYCLRHRRVEEGPDCPAKDRMGPYPGRTEAEHAMDLARERNERWRNDPRWSDDRDQDRDGEPGPGGGT
ncbi:hypothetical protein [Streptomyces hoynatensis]|uniref:SPOR domain-containing protein n=1 Tax=Streptomyces hoynatensis TaxID=1141874 RepID=A0A3A9ZFB5_9ACTN|nr:hypothetical protein [Streptomyces hoynatensis]RKN45926.1 hypothetical protein D7294_05730 [Streptomyces hoynatensis]